MLFVKCDDSFTHNIIYYYNIIIILRLEGLIIDMGTHMLQSLYYYSYCIYIYIYIYYYIYIHAKIFRLAFVCNTESW